MEEIKMTLRRKKGKDVNGNFITKARKCYICKEYKAFKTLHGGSICHYKGYTGKLCCDDCYVSVVKENEVMEKRDNVDMTEAEYVIDSWIY